MAESIANVCLELNDVLQEVLQPRSHEGHEEELND